MPKPPSDVPNSQVTPPPELEKRTRRRFSTAEKLRILDEARRANTWSWVHHQPPDSTALSDWTLT